MLFILNKNITLPQKKLLIVSKEGETMKFLKEWAISLLILACIVCIFLGYSWRVYHEMRQAESRYRMHVSQFLHELFSSDTNTISQYEGYVFIKRADGSIIIKRR